MYIKVFSGSFSEKAYYRMERNTVYDDLLIIKGGLIKAYQSFPHGEQHLAMTVRRKTDGDKD